MRSIVHWDETLMVLGGKDGLTLILQDWDTGLQLLDNLSGQDVKQRVEAARQKYGERFSWRAFSRAVDIWWNGEGGVLCEGSPIEEHTVHLETDYRRFPGASVFWQANLVDGRYTHAVVEPIRQAGRVVYVRLLALA
jgi:hypothetical protein